VNSLADSIFESDTRYLGVRLSPNAEFSPRDRIVSSAYSYRVGTVDGASGGAVSGNVSLSGNLSSSGDATFSGNVGIGTSDLGVSRLLVIDSVNDVNPVIAVKGIGENLSFGGSDAYGGYFTGASSGKSCGIKCDGFGSGGDAAIGCEGLGSDQSDVSGSAFGGLFTANSLTGISYGVYGTAADYGLYGGSGNQGVHGDGGTYGVYGNGTSYGVYGISNDAGVYGTGNNYGVYGYGGNYGVAGVAINNSGYGVYGSNGGNILTFGGYFVGEVYVSGFLTKAGGGFKIDHPTDPANKYLYHSFVESPDMKNIYDGVVTSDANGEAIVTLPDWFGAVNKDFRYQLTCIGGFAPVYVAEEISDNQFKIAGGTMGMKVSWQVTGIRKDAYAEAHRLPVEQEKPTTERGKYLHPQEHGVSETLGINYEMNEKIKMERIHQVDELAKAADERRQQEEHQLKLELEHKKQEEQRAKIGQKNK
jgi:hypothetical protein